MQSNQCLALILAVAVALAPAADAAILGPISKIATIAHWKGKIPLLKIKGAILVAPVAIPLAFGAKAMKIATVGTAMAVPAAIGAAIGAPLGAIIGAKAGAIKGAAVGKALLAAKVALGAKAAVAGLALATKPVVLVVGAKAKAAALGVHFLGKGAKFAAKGAAAAGQGLALFSQQLNDVSLKVKLAGASVADHIKQSFNSLPQVEMPTMSLNSVPGIPLETLLLLAKGPNTLESSIRLNTPLTGDKMTRATLVASRRRREASPQRPGVTTTRQGRQQGRQSAASGGNQQMNTLVNFVNQNKMQGCLTRIICELSANPNLYGNDGIQFGSSLLTMSRVEHPATQQYRSASTVGTSTRNPEECVKRFAQCTIPSRELVRIGNSMMRS